MRIPPPAEERACPVCGPDFPFRLFSRERLDSTRLDEFAFASRKLPEYMHLRLNECLNCGLAFASPVFAHGVLAAAYRDAAYDSSAAARFAARTYGRLAVDLAARLPSLDGVLDVGAGDGAFLAELLRAGFTNVTGIEPSRAPIEAASLEIRPLLRQEMFSADRFAAAAFSLVTCFQTIEHLEDPLGFCRDAAGLLRPGGALMLVCHNRRAMSARFLGENSPIFDLEHLQLFCPRSMRTLLTAAGLGRITVRSVWNRYPLSYWLRLFPLPPAAKSAVIRVLDRAGAGAIPIAIPAGNLVAIGFREA